MDLRRFDDLDSDEQSLVNEKVLAYSHALRRRGGNPLLTPFLEGLPQDLRRIAIKEMLHDEFQLRHDELTSTILSTHREEIDASETEIYFAEPSIAQSAKSLGKTDHWPKIYGFEVLEELQPGGTANVFLARERRFGRVVVIKVARCKRGIGPREIERFHLEAKLQSKYLGAAVPAVFGFGFASGGAPYIAMEYVKGVMLGSLFPKSPLPFTETRERIKLIAKVCHAIAPIHLDGGSHLDLSGGNVFITPEGQVKILDFGFGRDNSQRLGAREIAGTPGYLAPEKARGDSHLFSPATDVFSLGAFLAQMLTGMSLLSFEHSHDSSIEAIGKGDFGEWTTRFSRISKEMGVPQELIRLTLDCLSWSPEKRPSHAGKIAKQIDEYFRSEEARLRQLQIENARRSVLWKASLSVVGALVLGLIATSMLANWALKERNRASRNASLRLCALDDVLQIVGGEGLRRAGQTRLQRTVLEKLIPRFKEVLALEDQDDATLEQQALAWNAMTVIHQNMHEDSDALIAATKAEEILRKLVVKAQSPASRQLALAIALSNQSVMLGQGGNGKDSQKKSQEASSILNALITKDESNASLQFRLALADTNVANSSMILKELTTAESCYHSAISYASDACKQDPAEIAYRVWVARSTSNLALFYAEQLKKQEALQTANHALELSRSVLVEWPNELDSMECVAVCATNVGEILLEDKMWSESLPLFEEALTLYEQLGRMSPYYLEYEWGRAMSESNLGITLASLPDADLFEAISRLKTADSVYAQLMAKNPQNAELESYAKKNKDRLESVYEMQKSSNSRK